MQKINEREESGAAVVIRPPEALGIKRTEKEPAELERVSEIRDQIYDLLSRLIDIFDNMGPDHRARIEFSNTEHRIILHCLIDWRNQLLQEGTTGAAEGIGELILKLME